MRSVFALLIVFLPSMLLSQSRAVQPDELALRVEVEASAHMPLVGEMVLINIKGIYRRHITREEIIQPDFEGFNWTQLGADTWREERLNGEKVKTFSRRMAVYPNQAGNLTIGRFTHKLTLTDEKDDWFEHRITSELVSIEVAPAPTDSTWWFPVASLKVSDQWSNAPDQLKPGEGVLRVMRIEALGVTPEMIPPMPELKSPSARIFPHPEKRFVELSPAGPVSYAFWRWTIRPSNDTSTIVEPLKFDYFDTQARETRNVTISAQRVAYGTVVPESAPQTGGQVAQDLRETSVSLPGWPFAVLAAIAIPLGIWSGLNGRDISVKRALRRWRFLDPLVRQMTAAARIRDLIGMRQSAAALMHRDGVSDAHARLISELDHAIFSRKDAPFAAETFVKRFFRASKMKS